ncbi:ABC transporter permease [Ruania alba]|uniref:Nucleoside ABC transporter membrane protein n=1 Tax=Ruania alba TaxID=648782 RepID=A0A1H5CMU9_9MICO|nr:ABC transporter permease [Ruania alba]SED67915.1 nucleoside ABC transporter membrane protein [Ruania alba]
MSAPTTERELIGRSVLAPISWRTPIIMATLAALALFGFALFTPADLDSQIELTGGGAAWQLPDLVLPSRASALALVLVAFALAGLSFWTTQNRRRSVAVPVVFGVCLVLAFLIWAVAGNASGLPLPFLLSTAMTAALPLIFGAFAGLLCERSGVINIAIEGQLLAGAFLTAVLATVAGNPYIGLIAAPVGGALVGLLLAVFAIKYRVDQIIVGVVVNVLVLGLTSYLFSTVLSDNPLRLNSPPQLPSLRIPLLADIPVIGQALFNQNLIVYVMYVAVVLLHIGLFRSRWGLRVRAVGEHPKAADTVGIDVNRTRYRNVVFGSAVAGFGGASMVAAGLAFTKEVTEGRGYIALAAMILGRWSPTGALAAALLFGFADSLNRVLNNIGSPVPYEILAMLPYLATIFAVAGLVGRVRPPAGAGKAYPS